MDKQRIYLSGLLIGGMGPFEILYRRPNMFASATPICGNESTKLVNRYADKVPVWVFHGYDDQVVNPEHSLKIVNLQYGKFKKQNRKVVATHDWLTAFYNSPNFCV